MLFARAEIVWLMHRHGKPWSQAKVKEVLYTAGSTPRLSVSARLDP